MLPEQIKTIKSYRELSFKEKASEFIAIVYPVDNEETALNQLNEIRKKYYDASHHCYAYKLKSSEEKYSDDGEPKGTAGIRMLNAIQHFDLSDVMLVVVRYFGGTKLGVGPLGKAYYKASIDVLSKSKIVIQTLFRIVELESEFKFISQIHRIVKNHSAIISESDFTDKARFKCFVRPSDIEKINIELTNLTNGQILVTLSPDYHYF